MNTTAYFRRLILFLIIARAILMAWMPLTDPSEARYGVLAANMARGNDFILPQLVHNGALQSFDGKPPLFFQAGGVACKLLGTNPFAVRLPSLLAALGILLLLRGTVRRLATDTAALAAVLLCFSSAFFFLFSGICLTDMLLTFCTTGALCAYILFSASDTRRRQKTASIIFFAFLGLGMVAKGPVALVLAGLPVFLFTCIGKRWRELTRHAWIAGPLIFLAIAAPWYVLMAQRNPEFLEYFFINENFKRFITPEYGDKYGSGREMFRGVSLLWFIIVNLPAMLLLLIPAWKGHCCKRIFRKGDLSTRPLVALPLLGILSMVGFWALTSRVPIAYLLPSVPLTAILFAVKLDEWRLLEQPWMIRLFRIGLPVSCGLVVAGLLTVTLAGNSFTHQMAGAVMPHVKALQRQRPDLQTARYYFACRTPYSAEFYLGPAVRHHPQELTPASLRNSKDDILFISQRHQRHLKEPVRRELLLSSGVWHVYAPATERDTQ